MIEFMDGIVEAVEEFANASVENLIIIMGVVARVVAKAVILFTAPAWILPYKLIRDIMRDTNGGKCENPDCERCPFPPCEERGGGND